MSAHTTLADLAEAVGGRLRGDGGASITGVASVELAGPDEITWVTGRRYAAALAASRAGAVIIQKDFGETPMPAILCDDVEEAVALILERLALPTWRPEAGVHPTAIISESATLGSDVAIGPYVVVGDRTTVGDRCVLYAHVAVGPDVTIGTECVFWPHVVVRERSVIGSRVIIHPQAVIGSDGYGYRFAEGRHHKIPQTGIVRIEDDVEIGAGTCIDRAKVGATVIGQGTKIDNLVQIAHNVQIGPHCLLMAAVALGGTVELGQYVALGGKVAVRDHVTIGDGAKVAGCGGVWRDIPAGAEMGGVPARDGKLWIRQQMLLDRLPQIHAIVRELEKRVARLESTEDDQQDG